MIRGCQEIIYVKDTYRHTGRGKSGFEMHYKKRRCWRNAKGETGYCWQHQPPATGGPDESGSPSGGSGTSG